MSIEIPDESLRELITRPEDLRREVVIAMYEAGKIGGGKARELLGLDVRSWDGLAKARGLRGAYDVEDFEQDIKNLRELGRL